MGRGIFWRGCRCPMSALSSLKLGGQRGIELKIQCAHPTLQGMGYKFISQVAVQTLPKEFQGLAKEKPASPENASCLSLMFMLMSQP